MKKYTQTVSLNTNAKIYKKESSEKFIPCFIYVYVYNTYTNLQSYIYAAAVTITHVCICIYTLCKIKYTYLCASNYIFLYINFTTLGEIYIFYIHFIYIYTKREGISYKGWVKI